MNDFVDIEFVDNYVAGEPLTPRPVNNEPRDVFGDSLFTPPHDHQVGSFQPTPNALNAYKDYAREGGFEVRKGGQKYTKDSKDEPNNKNFYCVIKRRKRASCRCGCGTQLRLKKQPDGKYRVSKFIEKHNHVWYMKMSSPVRSWRVLKEMYGGFEYIGATDVDCKNYKRGLNEFIAERDAQMVGPSLCSDTDFKRRFCGIVWTDRIEPEVFDLFNPHLSLIEFLSHFDTAMDSQRYKYGKNTHDSKYTTPDFKTHLQVEKEAAELYTHTVFYDVQDEICESLFHCCSLSVQEDNTSLTYIIRDIEADYTTIHGVTVEAKYEVKYVPADCDIKCSCLKYECYGLLCRHIFYVLRLSKVFHFPRKYLQRRWSKYALPNKIVTRPVDVASLSNPVECVNGVLREIYGTVEDSVTRLVTDIQKLHINKDDLDTLLEQVKIDIPNAPEMSKQELYAAAFGVKEPETVNIVAPECRNKGSVSLKRHQTQAEIAMEPETVNIVAPECRNKGSVSLKRHQTQAEIAMVIMILVIVPRRKQIWRDKLPNTTTTGGDCCMSSTPKMYIGILKTDKPMRLCSYCGKYGYHDARNCPEKKPSIGKAVYQALYKQTYAFDNE
ncbi:FAR1 DNA binding domain, Zinc finger, SWIM-type, MULE transposase domain, FHY3/FAR1 family [Artemisia annua]|uniref:FAR1 DNA binding domain, Zinc finger, SWIM-type, MULE transposase domain, FHY3/FAR1 family n=1 Tax=Artemisia annua TaxID=35608 RepID=A0A2U1QDY2_ARTAN|nr:FAR1 DNA binding domain, Zinc finger, SWIM-type, MULE transposase domain, FHY3/FAR1 family [Artemisia annua]